MKIISRIFFRLLQLLLIIAFGYWIYLKFFGAPLEFAVLSIVFLPFIIPGLIVGFLISTIFLVVDLQKSKKFANVYNVIMLLLFLASIIYFAIQVKG